MKFLIAGFGSIGRRHLRNLRELGENDILLYRTGHSTLPDDEIAGLPVETDLRAALAHRPDCVFVCTPTALHLDTAIPAAEAGCHLMLEKPISHSLERVDQLRAAVERSGSRVVVGFQFRYHPTLNQAAELLAGGAIGQPVSARAHWGEYLPNWHPWEDFRQSYAARPELGGGVIVTLCHPLHYLRWLLGEVQHVEGFTSTHPLGLSVEESAEIMLQFASGITGSVHLDYVQRPAVHNLEIIGSEGTLRWDNADGKLSLYRASSEKWQEFNVPATFERNWLFMEELKHFIAVARGEEQPRNTLTDGIRTLEMALAARDSAAARAKA